MAPEPDLISRQEAAKRLGVHYNTVRNLQERGELVPVKENGHVYYAREQVEALREELGVEDEASDEELASLRTEVAMLREQIEHERSERDRLLRHILSGGKHTS